MTSEFWVARLNPSDASTAWPKALPLLEPAIRRGATLYDPDDIKALVTAPEAGTPRGWSLWILAERTQLLGAWTTNVRYYPKTPVLEIAFAGGDGMSRWYDLALSETEKFARECGCDRLRIGGRRGWEKFGYRSVGHLLERLL